MNVRKLNILSTYKTQNKKIRNLLSNIHTYIIGHYKPSVRIIDLVTHTTYIVCVNFIHK